jgi:chaperonin cofactor prefoldin
MKFAFGLIALLAGSSVTLATSSNPLSKVLELMADLTAKITAEGEVEGKAYHDYVEWCDEAAANLHNEIKVGEKKKDELEAVIAKCEADIESTDSKIEDLSGAISADEKQLKEATAVRKEEAATFLASEKELVDAVDTLGRAETILQKEMSKDPASFAQIDTRNVDSMLNGLSAVINAAGFSSNDQAKLTALVQQNSVSDDEEPGAPAAAVYKTHSGGIFDVLEDMKEKAESQLSDLRKAESNSKHQYEMLKQSLEDEIEADSKDLDEEKSLKASAAEKKASAEGDLAETVKELQKDKESLKITSTDCMQVASDHENTVKSRKEELAAIAEAEKNLKGDRRRSC